MIAKSRARSFHLLYLLLRKGKVYYKMCRNFIKKCGSFFHYKTRPKRVTKRGSFFVTKCVDVITERGSYDKTRRLLENAA